MSVPDDVWIAGFDDIAMSAWPAFDLTTARQPIPAMIETALDLLLSRIEDPGREPTAVRVGNEVIVRGSTDNQPLQSAETSLSHEPENTES